MVRLELMRVRVKLFAVHRQLLGRREVMMEVPSGATIADVWAQLKNDHAPLSHLSNTVVAALNHDYAALDAAVHDGDELAFIPPVSGG